MALFAIRHQGAKLFWAKGENLSVLAIFRGFWLLCGLGTGQRRKGLRSNPPQWGRSSLQPSREATFDLQGVILRSPFHHAKVATNVSYFCKSFSFKITIICLSKEWRDGGISLQFNIMKYSNNLEIFQSSGIEFIIWPKSSFLLNFLSKDWWCGGISLQFFCIYVFK